MSNAKIQFQTKDIPDLSGKVILVTGGTAGLGEATVTELAKHNPSHIYFTGRNSSSAEKIIETIKSSLPNVSVSFLKCDQSSLDSVQACAKDFLAKSSRLDILIANAGVMALPAGLTTDGYEIQFGINHVAHALLIKLLLPLLLQTAKEPNADVRVVIVSTGFMLPPKKSTAGINLNTIKTPQESFFLASTLRYMQSKAANVLYAAELARRIPDITFASLWPGVILTGLVSRSSLPTRLLVKLTTSPIPVEEGVLNQLWAATGHKGDVESGRYYMYPGVLNKYLNQSVYDKSAVELWDWTENELKRYMA